MGMTNASMYRFEGLFPEQFLYQNPKQTVSGPGVVFIPQDFGRFLPTHIKKKQPPPPVTTREQLMLISAFFGFSKSKLGEIFGVSRQSIYNWFDNSEVAVEHYEKIKRLADIAFEVDPQPSQQIFHVYANTMMDGYDKSLFDYLRDNDFDKDKVIKLSKTVYEMSRERWKRIDAMPKAHE